MSRTHTNPVREQLLRWDVLPEERELVGDDAGEGGFDVGVEMAALVDADCRLWDLSSSLLRDGARGDGVVSLRSGSGWDISMFDMTR